MASPPSAPTRSGRPAAARKGAESPHLIRVTCVGGRTPSSLWKALPPLQPPQAGASAPSAGEGGCWPVSPGSPGPGGRPSSPTARPWGMITEPGAAGHPGACLGCSPQAHTLGLVFTEKTLALPSRDSGDGLWAGMSPSWASLRLGPWAPFGPDRCAAREGEGPPAPLQRRSEARRAPGCLHGPWGPRHPPHAVFLRGPALPRACGRRLV